MFYGASALLIGTGVVTILTDPGREKPRAAKSTSPSVLERVSVSPRVGARRGGGLDLSVRF